MTKSLRKFDSMMNNFYSGKFGRSPMTMKDILISSGNENLLYEMSLSELNTLKEKSWGMSSYLYTLYINKTKERTQKMEALETELFGMGIQGKSDLELASAFRLNVENVPLYSLGRDIEAILEPAYSDSYNGTIKIASDPSTKFNCMHEIIHYVRDVGVGNQVKETYTRKSTGRTDCIKEQEVNYLTAAALMPLIDFYRHTKRYEEIPIQEESGFLERLAKQYNQDLIAIKRRLVEAKLLDDAGYVIPQMVTV